MQQLSIFISYSRRDKVIAAQLETLLERAGHHTFIDRELLPGQPWKDVLQEKIDDCSALLFIVSQDSLESDWCRWEFLEAQRQNKPIFPVLLAHHLSIPPELEALGDIQMLDMTEGVTLDAAAALIGGLHQMVLEHNKVPRIAIKEPPLDFGSTEPLTRIPTKRITQLPPTITATLRIVYSETVLPATFPIRNIKNVIGRSSKTDIRIPEKRISSNHAAIYFSNGKFYLIDDSLNGTWLNGERLKKRSFYPLEANTDHRIELSANYTRLSFRYTVEQL